MFQEITTGGTLRQILKSSIPVSIRDILDNNPCVSDTLGSET